jgi:hypothetical protein
MIYVIYRTDITQSSKAFHLQSHRNSIGEMMKNEERRRYEIGIQAGCGGEVISCTAAS